MDMASIMKKIYSLPGDSAVSKYATQKTFDGRKARIGDTVVLACPKQVVGMFTHVVLRAGIVGAISSSRDIPYLRDLRSDSGIQDVDPERWVFVPTKTEEDIEKLEIGQWTWPLS
jgi:hypothetical protein